MMSSQCKLLVSSLLQSSEPPETWPDFLGLGKSHAYIDQPEDVGRNYLTRYEKASATCLVPSPPAVLAVQGYRRTKARSVRRAVGHDAVGNTISRSKAAAAVRRDDWWSRGASIAGFHEASFGRDNRKRISRTKLRSTNSASSWFKSGRAVAASRVCDERSG